MKYLEQSLPSIRFHMDRTRKQNKLWEIPLRSAQLGSRKLVLVMLWSTLILFETGDITLNHGKHNYHKWTTGVPFQFFSQCFLFVYFIYNTDWWNTVVAACVLSGCSETHKSVYSVRTQQDHRVAFVNYPGQARKEKKREREVHWPQVAQD